jgi:hypothetical protein
VVDRFVGLARFELDPLTPRSAGFWSLSVNDISLISVVDRGPALILVAQWEHHDVR